MPDGTLGILILKRCKMKKSDCILFEVNNESKRKISDKVFEQPLPITPPQYRYYCSKKEYTLPIGKDVKIVEVQDERKD